MGKLIHGDGNGGITVSKGLALAISIITLCSIVWALASAYVVQMAVKPFELRVEALEKFAEERRVTLQSHIIDNTNSYAELNRKIDILIYKIDQQSNGK